MTTATRTGFLKKLEPFRRQILRDTHILTCQLTAPVFILFCPHDWQAAGITWNGMLVASADVPYPIIGVQL